MRILSMSGFVAEQICDTVRFTGYTGERNITHYCGYASDFISQVKYDEAIDGAVFPRSCDSSRIIRNYLDGSNKFIYQISVPARNDELAIDYFATEIENYKNALEAHYHIALENISERVSFIEARNKKIEDLYQNLDTISYSEYLQSIHDMLKKPLFEQSVQTSFRRKSKVSKRVYLVGSFLSNVKIVEMIENLGMVIVGDNLPESGRLVSSPSMNQYDSIYKDIASSVLKRRMSPSQNVFADILSKDIEEIEKKSVNGVIFITQKYCETYDYLYFAYKKMLENIGIPVLKVVLSDSEDNKKVELAIEAFADMI